MHFIYNGDNFKNRYKSYEAKKIYIDYDNTGIKEIHKYTNNLRGI